MKIPIPFSKAGRGKCPMHSPTQTPLTPLLLDLFVSTLRKRDINNFQACSKRIVKRVKRDLINF